MGASGSNLPANNLVVLLHLEDTKKIKALIEQKTKEENFNINEPINKMGDTILHYASYKKNKDLVKYLLLQGSNPTLKNTRDQTPLDVAGDDEIKTLLSQKH
ncbi:hypothetical protein ABPG74_003852 [Tetrahymena malaccensis]